MAMALVGLVGVAEDQLEPALHGAAQPVDHDDDQRSALGEVVVRFEQDLIERVVAGLGGQVGDDQVERATSTSRRPGLSTACAFVSRLLSMFSRAASTARTSVSTSVTVAVGQRLASVRPIAP